MMIIVFLSVIAGLFLANMALSDILFLVAYVPLVSVLATMGDRLVITKSDCLPLGIFASVCYYASVLATLGVVAERYTFHITHMLR